MSLELAILMQQNRQTDRGNIQIAYRNMNVDTGNEAAQFHLVIFVSNFQYSVFAVHAEGGRT